MTNKEKTLPAVCRESFFVCALVVWTKIWYTVLYDAPSPSGKAEDFDSSIAGSTPAGATIKKSAQFADFE